MLTNLTLKGFTWPREPVLYLGLLVAIINAVIALLQDSVEFQTAMETLIVLVTAFVARGRVAPLS